MVCKWINTPVNANNLCKRYYFVETTIIIVLHVGFFLKKEREKQVDETKLSRRYEKGKNSIVELSCETQSCSH